MYIVPFTSESGDHYIIGPFPQIPSHEEVLNTFTRLNPAEGEYVKELCEGGAWDPNPFTAYPLPENPGLLDLQMASNGVKCV